MKKYIVLFRGINVGGNKLMPMKTLVPLLEKQGFSDVYSYIQSGNVVLHGEHNPTNVIQKLVVDNFGFSADIFVIEESKFSSIVSHNPYQEFEGKFVHFYVCQDNVDLNLEKTTKYITNSEEYLIKDNVFYLYAPDGIGRSKLVKNIEVCLGQLATGRNLNTINKIKGLLTIVS